MVYMLRLLVIKGILTIHLIFLVMVSNMQTKDESFTRRDMKLTDTLLGLVGSTLIEYFGKFSSCAR